MKNTLYYSGKDGQVYGPHVTSGNHYLYAHVNPETGKTFYIGLGKGNRCNQITKRNFLWKQCFKKHGMKVRILKQDLPKEDGLILEKKLILRLKPEGNIVFGETSIRNSGIKVFAFNEKGELFKGFRCITEANAFFGIKTNDSRIIRCLAGRRQKFKGFLWSKDRNAPPVLRAKKKAPAKQVHEYDLDGNWKASYDSPRDANVPTRTGIYGTLDKPQTYAGSFWKTFKVVRLNELPPTPSLIPSKKLICLQSGQIFDSISKAAKHINMPHQTLIKRLHGKLKNNTGLQFYAQQESNNS